VSFAQQLASLACEQVHEVDDQLRDSAWRLANEPIAIVGAGCRYPGGIDSPAALWTALLEGRDAVGASVEPGRESPADDAPSDLSARMRQGGFVEGLTGLDTVHFGISPREARAIDPQQRLLLEVCSEALQHAGLPSAAVARMPTGVYVGLYYNDYLQRGLAASEPIDAYTLTGGLHSVAAGRIAYLLDLKGPAVAVDTACSSSLAAVHLASQALRLREIDLALAGGANVVLDAPVGVSLARYGLLSERARCRTFDKHADGIVRSDGCGVVVLRRLIDALHEGDRIMGVILASAINNDGRSNGLTAPSGSAQQRLLLDALGRSGVESNSIALIETHGTGTALGDPIEVESLAAVYGSGAPLTCALGAVKTNLGHTEAAAGVAGLLKATLAVQHGAIPPNLHLVEVNPDVRLAGTRFFLPARTHAWPVDGVPRRAAVSSFGIGGTNAHIVVEQPPPRLAEVSGEASGPTLLVVSAADADRARRAAQRLADWLEGPAGSASSLSDLAYTLSRRRDHAAGRISVVGEDRRELARALRLVARGKRASRGARGLATDTREAVWLLSGHGSHWTGMGRALLDAAGPAATGTIELLDPIYRKELGWPLSTALTEVGLAKSPADVVQPLIFAVQAILMRWWRDRGACPAAVIGHSMGEVAASVACGALDLSTAARLICRRSVVLRDAVGSGRMLHIQAPAERVERDIRERAQPGSELAVAIIPSPGATVVSGPPDQIDVYGQTWRARGVQVRAIAADVAFHGPQMVPLADRLTAAIADLPAARPPGVTFYSTACSDPRAAVAFDGDYWATNLRASVRLAAAVTAAVQDGHRAFLEISPHPIALAAVAASAPSAELIPTMRKGGATRADLLAAVGRLYCSGATVDWSRVHPSGSLVDAPATTWVRERHWIERPPAAAIQAAAATKTYELAWRDADEPRSDRIGVARHWVVVGGKDAVAELAGELRTRGQHVTCVESAGNLFAADPSSGDPDRVVVVVDSGNRSADDALRVTLSILGLARSLGRRPLAPRLHLLTAGAQPAGAARCSPAPAQACLWGLGRSLALELPGIWGGLVDLDPCAESLSRASRAADALIAQAAGVAEPELAIRGGRWRVPRLCESDGELPHAPRVQGCVLITGASGTVGPHLMRSLAVRGARDMAVVTRHGLRGCALTAAKDLRKAGVRIHDVHADVADERAMERLFGRFGRSLPALGEVHHAALSGGATELSALTDDDVTAMFAAKAHGAEILHRLTVERRIGAFALFSTTTSLLGARGLAHYAAANAFLDALAHSRAAQGLPALAVNWGALADWFASVAPAHRDAMHAAGMRPVSDRRAMAILGSAIGMPTAQLVVTAIHWPTLVAAYRTRVPLPIVDELLAGIAGGGATPLHERPRMTRRQPRAAATLTPLRRRLAAAPEPARRPLLEQHVADVVGQVLGFADAAPPADVGFVQLGMDSLQAVEVQRRLSADLQCPVPSSAIFNFPTVAALARHLGTVALASSWADDERLEAM
jgi:phthiocerol/phenolphthiocerol synthesis type-I polyketide synthase B